MTNPSSLSNLWCQDISMSFSDGSTAFPQRSSVKTHHVDHEARVARCIPKDFLAGVSETQKGRTLTSTKCVCVCVCVLGGFQLQRVDYDEPMPYPETRKRSSQIICEQTPYTSLKPSNASIRWYSTEGYYVGDNDLRFQLLMASI
jgi:hypothetical protein